MTPDGSDAAPPRRYGDVNAVAGGLLRDLAAVQTSPQKTFGYKRAAAAVLSLEQPLTELRRPDGTLDVRLHGLSSCVPIGAPLHGQHAHPAHDVFAILPKDVDERTVLAAQKGSAAQAVGVFARDRAARVDHFLVQV